MEKPFDNNPGFYIEDNRKNRNHNPITKEMLENKHFVLFPERLIKNKKILDLGSCIGATGQWCLFYGAKSYTGIEIQIEYVNISKKLLSHHGKKAIIKNVSIETFLKENKNKYDIVVLSGVLYVFLDYYLILKQISNICNESIIIDMIMPDFRKINPNTSAIEIVTNQIINNAKFDGSIFGLGTNITPNGLIKIFSTLYFIPDGGVLYPKQINNSLDIYNSNSINNRYLMRFLRTNYKINSLSEDLISGKSKNNLKWKNNIEQKMINNISGSWDFNEEEAKKFKNTAIKQIPNYYIVLKKCLEFALKYYKKDIKILDIGSAIGETLSIFHKAGYSNIFGVEKSKHMIKHSFKKATIIQSSNFPFKLGKFDFIMANWTLHFNNNREKYIKDIFNSLNKGGVFILSEKVKSSNEIHELYYDFKRKNGMLEDEIIKKEIMLRGVLIQYPLEWYLKTLKNVGFKDIEIIDASYSFVTFLSKK